MNTLILNSAYCTSRRLLKRINRDFWDDMERHERARHLYLIGDYSSIFPLIEGTEADLVLGPDDVITDDLRSLTWPGFTEEQTDLRRYLLYRVALLKERWSDAINTLHTCRLLLKAGPGPRALNETLTKVIHVWVCFLSCHD